MRNIISLLFNPNGKISGPVYILGIAVSIILFMVLSGFCLAVRFLTPFQGAPLNIAFGIVLVSFVYQINILTLKRLKEIGILTFIKNSTRRLFSILAALAGLGIVIGLIAVFALIWQAFHIPEIISAKGGSVHVTECTCPFGSWFNRNELTVAPGGFLYEKKGVLGTRSLNIPYAKIKKVEFTDGIFWNRITILLPDFSLFKNEMYLLSDANFNGIKNDIRSMAGNYVIIQEDKSLFNQALHPLSK